MRFIVCLSDLRITYCVACDSRVHARAVRSGTTTATTDVRVLPEASVARVLLGAAAALLLLGARVPVTAWPRRARVCLSFSLRLSNRVIVAPCLFVAVQY